MESVARRREDCGLVGAATVPFCDGEAGGGDGGEGYLWYQVMWMSIARIVGVR